MQAMLEKIARAADTLKGLQKDLQLVKAGKPTQDGKAKSVEA
jgi:hypothetical protein